MGSGCQRAGGGVCLAQLRPDCTKLTLVVQNDINYAVTAGEPPPKVSQSAVEQRLRGLPPSLFQAVLLDLLPRLHERWRERKRPVAPAIDWAQRRFSAGLALDGSTLDTLLRKVGLLRDGEGPRLAGRMAALLDLASQLPRQVWYEQDWHAHDQRFWDRVLSSLVQGTLLIFDLGFRNYARFDHLTEQGVFFLTHTTTTIARRTEQVVRANEAVRDQWVWVGSGTASCCQHLLRMVEVRYAGTWYRDLTNVVDPKLLPSEYVVALYWQRWRSEDAFNIVKRLLGLAYFWTGSLK